MGLLSPEGYTIAPMRFARIMCCLKPSACRFVLAIAVRGMRAESGEREGEEGR